MAACCLGAERSSDPGRREPPIDPAIHSEHNRQDRNPDHALPHPHQGAVSRNRSTRGKGMAALAGAWTPEAIEPGDRYPGIVRREATDVAASRCRQSDSATCTGARANAIVRTPLAGVGAVGAPGPHLAGKRCGGTCHGRPSAARPPRVGSCLAVRASGRSRAVVVCRAGGFDARRSCCRSASISSRLRPLVSVTNAFTNSAATIPRPA